MVKAIVMKQLPLHLKGGCVLLLLQKGLGGVVWVLFFFFLVRVQPKLF